MHRIITKLLTIPVAGTGLPALSIRFVSIAWSEESKMAVSDRGLASEKTEKRRRSEDEGRRGSLIGGIRSPSSRDERSGR